MALLNGLAAACADAVSDLLPRPPGSPQRAQRTEFVIIKARPLSRQGPQTGYRGIDVVCHACSVVGTWRRCQCGVDTGVCGPHRTGRVRQHHSLPIHKYGRLMRILTCSWAVCTAPVGYGRGMRIYAVSNQKGGVGKTTSTVNLGAALAGAGRRVLLIDFDPQGHLTVCVGAGAAGSGPADANLPKALLGKWSGSLEELLVEIGPRLWLIPTSDEMFLLEPELYGRTGRERLLARFLEPLADLIDDVVIDCPPSLGALNDAALVAARRRDDGEITGSVVIPVEAADSSIGALRLLLRQIATLQDALDIQIDIAGLVVSTYDARRGRIATSTMAAFEQHPLGVLGVIHQRAALTEAWRARKHVLDYAPDSSSAAEFRALARALEPSLPTAEPTRSQT